MMRDLNDIGTSVLREAGDSCASSMHECGGRLGDDADKLELYPHNGKVGLSVADYKFEDVDEHGLVKNVVPYDHVWETGVVEDSRIHSNLKFGSDDEECLDPIKDQMSMSQWLDMHQKVAEEARGKCEDVKQLLQDTEKVSAISEPNYWQLRIHLKKIMAKMKEESFKKRHSAWELSEQADELEASASAVEQLLTRSA